MNGCNGFIFRVVFAPFLLNFLRSSQLEHKTINLKFEKMTLFGQFLKISLFFFSSSFATLEKRTEQG